jgi:hypothetical protein
MIEGSLLKSNFIGKDGFVWWIGQIAPAAVWRTEMTDPDTLSVENPLGTAWAYRCKVRVIGYHPFDREVLPDNDLPWAHVMTTGADGAAQGGVGQTLRLTGGETAFGFFIDGEEAQQPVVVGCIHRNESVGSFPLESIKDELKPFSASRGKLVQGPTQQKALSTVTQGSADTSPNPLPNAGSSATPGKIPSPESEPTTPEGDTTTVPGADKLTREDKASAKHAAILSTVKIVRENGCNDNLIGKISSILNDFIGFISVIQEFQGSYIDPITNTFVDIAQSIKGFASRIAGVVKFIVNNMRGAIINLVTSLFRDFIAKILPLPQHPPVAEATKNIINIIFCLFENLLPKLLQFIENLLTNMVGRVINAPLCAAEEFTAGILGKMMELLDDILEPVMSGLDWLLGGLSQISSVLSQVSSVAQQILNFIGCDQLKCQPASTWSPLTGPLSNYKDSWARTLSKLDLLKGVNESIDEAMGFTSLFGYTGNSPFRDCSREAINPSKQDSITPLPPGIKAAICIPPEIRIYGDGVQAAAVPIVADDGSILTVEVLNAGKGYTKAPSATIIDNTNHGTGAELGVNIENGTISGIYVINAGTGFCKGDYTNLAPPPTYLVTANKYTVFEGDTVEFTINTTNTPDGTKLEYDITGDINLSDINLKKLNKKININNNTASLIIKVKQDSEPEAVETMFFNLFDKDGTLVANTLVFVNDVATPLLVPEPTDPSESPPGVTPPPPGGGSTGPTPKPPTPPDIDPPGPTPVTPPSPPPIPIDPDTPPGIPDPPLPPEPPSPIDATYTLSASKTSIDEGESVTFTLKTTNVPSNTSVGYSLSGISDNDVVGGKTLGFFTIGNDGQATVTIKTVIDSLNELVEVMRMTLNNGKAFSSVTIRDINPQPPEPPTPEPIPDPDPTPEPTPGPTPDPDPNSVRYKLVSDKSTLLKGENVLITLSTTNLDDGQRVSYTISGVNSGDLSPESSLTGNFVVNSNKSQVLIKTIINDSEEDKVIRLTLNNGRSSIQIPLTNKREPIVPGGTYKLSSDKPRVSEGESFNVTLSTKNINDGEKVGYTISGVTPDDLASGTKLQGEFIVQSNISTLQIQTLEDNFPSENNILFLSLNNGKDSVSIPLIDKPVGVGTTSVGIITSVVPVTPGIGYTSGDRVVMGPCSYTPILAPNGSIIGVTSLTCNSRFSEYPTVEIITNTGDGASIYPILKYTPLYTKVRTFNQVGVVSYVDCV